MKLPGLSDLLGVYLLVVLVCFGHSFVGDPGIGWHLRSGEWILSHNQVPRTDPFLFSLFSSEGDAWVHNQWLADLVLWKVYSLGGFPLLHVLGIGLCIATFIVVLAPLLYRYTSSGVGVLLLTLLCAVLGSLQWLLRPVLFSFFFFAVVYRICCRWYPSEGDSKGKLTSVYLLPFLFLLWANIHPAFVLGLGLLLVCLLAAYLDTRLLSKDNTRDEKKAKQKRRVKFSVIVLLCLGATLVNPYGFALYQGIIALVRNTYFMKLNREWLSPVIWQLAFLPFFFSLILFCCFLVLRKAWRRLTLFEWLIVLGIGGMAVFQRRYIPFWGIVMSVPMIKLISGGKEKVHGGTIPFLSRQREMISRAARNLNQFDESGTRYLISVSLWVLVVLYVLVRGHLPFQDLAYSDLPQHFPKQAVDALVRAQPQDDARIFHGPDWGGYLIWRLYPRRMTFIDDRNVLNGKRKYQEFFLADAARPGWDHVFDRYGFDWALLSPRSTLAQLLTVLDEWELVFTSPPSEHPDAQAVLFRRTQESFP